MTARALRLSMLIRSHIWTLFAMFAVAALVFELGGIWNELHQMRKEQVKNALYSLSDQRRASIGNTPSGRRLENTVNVNGSVEIDGKVELEEPVEVEIDH